MSGAREALPEKTLRLRRFLEAPKRGQRNSEIVVNLGARLSEANGFPQLVYRLIRPPGLLEDEAEVAARFGKVRTQRERAPKPFAGGLQFASCAGDVSESIADLVAGRKQFESVSIEALCVVERAMHVQQLPDGQVDRQVVRPRADDPDEQRDRFGAPGCLKHQRAERDDGIDVVGMARQNLPVNELRFAEAAFTVMHLPELHRRINRRGGRVLSGWNVRDRRTGSRR